MVEARMIAKVSQVLGQQWMRKHKKHEDDKRRLTNVIA